MIFLKLFFKIIRANFKITGGKIISQKLFYHVKIKLDLLMDNSYMINAKKKF